MHSGHVLAGNTAVCSENRLVSIACSNRKVCSV